MLLLLLGCQHDQNAHLYTTLKPSTADVVGHYQLTKQTVAPGGLSAFKGKVSTVDLRKDGSFTAAHIPPFNMLSSQTLLEELISPSGSWRLERVGVIDNGSGSTKPHWGVYFDSQNSLVATVGLMGSSPPYDLVFTIGDPDSGKVMILEKLKNTASGNAG